jgi:hypothetical protein
VSSPILISEWLLTILSQRRSPWMMTGLGVEVVEAEEDLAAELAKGGGSRVVCARGGSHGGLPEVKSSVTG